MKQFKSVFSTLTTLIIRGVGSVLQLALNAVLGTYFGAAAVGIFQLLFIWSNFFTLIYSLGFPVFVLKKAAESKQFGIRLFLQILMLSASFGVVVSLGYSSSGLFSTDPIIESASLVAFAYLMLKLLSELLKGYKLARQAFFCEFIVYPTFMITALMYVKTSGEDLDSSLIFLLYLSALILSVTIAFLIVASKNLLTKNTESVNDMNSGQRKQLGTYWLILGINTLYSTAPFILMTFFYPLEVVGLFAVAFKLVSVMGTITVSIGGIFAPKFVLYNKGVEYYPEVKKAYVQSQAIGIGLFSLVLIALVLFDQQILAIFGDGFEEASDLLLILLVGRYIAVCFGQTEYFLNMINKQNIELMSGVLGLLLYVVIGYPIINTYDVNGVAILTALSFMLRAGISYVFVYQTLRA